MVPIRIRKLVTIAEEIHGEAGIGAARPLRRVAAVAVIGNPYAGRYQEDLSELVEYSRELGRLLGTRAVEALGAAPESYGKGAIVGVNGEAEHGNACHTAAFGDELRKAVGGGKAWLPFATKVGPMGTSLDVSIVYKDALFVRSHYDTMEVRIPDAPAPDEIVVVAVVSSGARLNARLGGLTKDQAKGQDGLT